MKIEYLKDFPQFIDACAAWAYGRWGVQSKTSSLKKALNKFSKSSQKNKIPMTVIAISYETNLPMGMGSLWEDDGDGWKDKTPWIAAVYTLYRYRGQGVATKIIKRLEEEAKGLGYNKIYLKAGFAANFYPKLGYKVIDEIKIKNSSTGREVLFVKNL